MKINTISAKKSILAILDEDSISPEEIAKRAGISKTTVYNIIDESVDGVHRATIRNIAAGTGRSFKIVGDKVHFYREEKVSEKEIDPLDRQIIELINRQPKKRKQLLLRMIGEICLALDMDGEKEEQS